MLKKKKNKKWRCSSIEHLPRVNKSLISVPNNQEAGGSNSKNGKNSAAVMYMLHEI
jgi:hypothetical protein